MNLQTDYFEYGVQLSLSIVGAAAAYTIDPSNPLTFLSLLLLPLLFGYTAFISQEGFNYASLASMAALCFVVVGGSTAIISLFYGIGNILVSYFSTGNRFKDFYGSTSLPMLLVGFLISLSVLAYGSLNPSFQEELAEKVGERSGSLVNEVVPVSDIVQAQKRSQMRMVNSTVALTYQLTSEEIVKRTENRVQVARAFREAKEPVKQRVYERFRDQMESKQLDMSGRVQQTVTKQLKALNFIVVLPVIAGFFYSLQPLIGMLTGLFGKIFLLLGGSSN